jgi:hypothetical protein
MTKNENRVLLYAGGAAIGYFGVLHPLLVKLGIFKSKAEKDAEKAKQQALADFLAQQTGTPTKSAAEWNIIADTIYQDLRYSALDDNKADAVYQIARVKNNADIATLLKVFGYRQEYWFGLPAGDPKNLQTFVTSNLSDSKINEINSNFQRKGISYRF